MLPLTAASILFLTVGLSLARPTVAGVRVQPQIAALLGALLTLTVGLLTPPAAYDALKTLVVPVVTIVSLMTITLVAEQAGVFEDVARHVARSARGNGRVLFRNLFLLGTVTGAFFTNDAAVLIYTPLVFALIERLAHPSWGLAERLPYYFAVLYVANLVGPLVISNPINIIVASWFDVGFLEYASWMSLPALASMVVSYCGLRLVFRHSLPATYTVPGPHIRSGSSGFRRVTAGILFLTLVGFFSGPLIGFSTVYVAAAGAVTLLLLHCFMAHGSVRCIVGRVGWDVIVFVACIFLVASGLRAAGVTELISGMVAWAVAGGSGMAAAATAFAAGIASSVLNNHPVAQLMAMSIAEADVVEGARRGLVFAALIGGDLGPKMLPIGSLAALMWFRMLRDRGVEVSYRTYVRVGVPVTLVAIGAAVLVLWAELALF
ncbi:MAG: hypothetical protein L0271_09875 [Gemmatimonadetes bacterium]|nr:hypothetical protein [Gemmatimonadota bacterium]